MYQYSDFPRKTNECRLKFDGWKMYFLLKYIHFCWSNLGRTPSLPGPKSTRVGPLNCPFIIGRNPKGNEKVFQLHLFSGAFDGSFSECRWWLEVSTHLKNTG